MRDSQTLITTIRQQPRQHKLHGKHSIWHREPKNAHNKDNKKCLAWVQKNKILLYHKTLVFPQVGFLGSSMVALLFRNYQSTSSAQIRNKKCIHFGH